MLKGLNSNKDSSLNLCAVGESRSTVVPYRSPANWPLEEAEDGARMRKFIRFSERPTGFETNFACLQRTLCHIVPKQEANGCFLSPDEIRLPDKSDDHLGVAGMLAYYLSLSETHPEWIQALSRAVRYQIDHLCFTAPNVSGRYVRFYLDQDSPLDWCNTLWSLQGLNLVLEFGQGLISNDLYLEALELGRSFWSYLTDYPARDENPCHNQLLEYVSIGYTYGRVTGRVEVCEYTLDYYKNVLRQLRIFDRGRWIYTEFNRWCAHYALLSWCALEHLWVESGDPLCEEDAIEMAAAFSDRISAGGFYFGGARRDEPGYETFLYQFWLRGQAFNFDRLLLPEPSNLWRDLIYDGHNGRSLVAEMILFLKHPKTAQIEIPASNYTMLKERCSVRFNQNATPRHLSVNGLELLEANLPDSRNSPLQWKQDGEWVEDSILATPPPSSELQRYSSVLGQCFSHLEVRATMQRGSEWEIREWWLSDGKRLQWVGHFIAHNAVKTEAVKYVVGNPYLSESRGVVGPVQTVSNSMQSVKTYGAKQLLKSSGTLLIGNQYIVSSNSIQFVRPDRDAFDGFPARNRKLWEKQKDSNRIEISLSTNPKQFKFRESLFVGFEIGSEQTSLETAKCSDGWECKGGLGCFKAQQVNGRWAYEWHTKDAGVHELLNPAFGLSSSHQ